MSLVRVWNSLFKAAIILINVVNEPLIAVMDLTLQLTTTHTRRRCRLVRVGVKYMYKYISVSVCVCQPVKKKKMSDCTLKTEKKIKKLCTIYNFSISVF